MSSAMSLLLGLETALIARANPVLAAARPKCTSSRSEHLSPDRQMRRERQLAWYTATTRTDYAKSVCKMLQAEWSYLCQVLDEHAPRKSDEDNALATWRLAIAVQIVTPAPDRTAVAWKRRMAKDQGERLPIAKEAIDAAIAEDEAWLAAHVTPQAKAVRASWQRRKGATLRAVA